MLKKLYEKVDFFFIASVVTSWTILLMFVSKSLNEDNLIYAIGEIQAYNNSLFNGNIYMGDGVISPRYIVDNIFNLLMHLNGGEWAEAALIWIYFGAIIQSIAIANIAVHIDKKYQIAISAILLCFIIYCNNYLAGFSLIALASTSIGIALAFAFLSISFLIGNKRNYCAAWVFAACAVICHVHEGIYCCAGVFLFAVADSIHQKKPLIKENCALVIAVIALFAVVVPTCLTDTMELSNEDFVYIYSIFRHPHHLVPSTWGIDSIYKTIWVDVSFFLLCIAAELIINHETVKNKVIESLLFSGAWIIAIMFMYVFTEIKPIALVSTMFFSKSFKYVLLIGLIWIVNASFKMREKQMLLSHYIFIYYALTVTMYDLKQIGIVLIFVLVLMRVELFFLEYGKAILSNNVALFSDILFFSFLICVRRESLDIGIGSLIKIIIDFKSSIKSALTNGFEQGITIILVFIAIFAINLALKKKFKGHRFFLLFVIACTIGLSLMGRVIIYLVSQKFSQLISRSISSCPAGICLLEIIFVMVNRSSPAIKRNKLI